MKCRDLYRAAFRLAGFWLSLVLFVGCSDDRPTLVDAKGKVLIDGRPVTAGSIVFHPSLTNSYVSDKPSSILQLDGGFTMKTFPFGEGVCPGEYMVTLAPELAQRLKLPKYSSPDSSPWRLTVPETGLRNVVLEVQ